MPVDLEKYYALNKPRSDQLNAIDLIGGPITVTITDANNGNTEQILWLSITGGHKPYKPCFNMRNLMAFAWENKDPNTWIGKALTLWLNPDVVYKGEVTGGIQISHVSHITEVKSIKLNVGRNKREVFSVKPLPDAAPPQPKPDIPPAIAAVLDEWRPKLTGQPKRVLEMSGRIAAVRTPDQSGEVEAYLNEWIHPDEKILLTDFLKAIIAVLA